SSTPENSRLATTLTLLLMIIVDDAESARMGENSDHTSCVFFAEPMCRQHGMSSSVNVAQNGSQYGSLKCGKPYICGPAVHTTARWPSACARRTSATASSTSHIGARHCATKRGLNPDHSSTSQSLYARMHAIRRSTSP